MTSRPLLIKAVLLLFFLISIKSTAQSIDIERVDPTSWWVGMQNPKLQLMVHGESIGTAEVKLNKYNGVKLTGITRVENPNYIFIDLEIKAKAKAGKLRFEFQNGEQSIARTYELRQKQNVDIQSLSQKDVIYLILPDRFSNGDLSNDKFADMADPESDRNNPWLRHGGDLQGIINHLDYLKELGVTALWLNPVIENDQPQTNEGGNMRSAYHGYGFTDHYAIDRRLGGNKKYAEFIQKAHEKGFKVIQDAVYNHVGINHYTVKDLPMKSWLNQWDEYTNTSYKEQPALDPNASQYDRLRMTDGWFMPFLPDLNQRNPLVANYLIQHALWTVQNFGIDAYRIDTYMYNDMAFMNACNAALKAEYPDLFLFGESLANPVPNVAAFVKNNMELDFACNLESTVDYQVHSNMLKALSEGYGWHEGANRLYETLVQDYLYQNPEKLVTYLDNHDEHRFFSVVGEDYRKFKLGLTWLMTLRGIPEIYYGTEILTKNFKNPTDAEVRKDFPGGWPDDEVNKFQKEGRTEIENETFDFVKKLISIRTTEKAIGEGDFIQFMPFDDGVYVYFRTAGDETIMVATNTVNSSKSFSTKRFEEVLKGRKKATYLMTGEELTDLSIIELNAYEALLLKLHD
ncbi:alpha-amylase family glycosyl hydrolase [Jiulongibacter sediminis]|uniref:Alpha-amylase n=1 Tax=Jiulongibacter sediminis TaxID=1605367 RepID=A0A0N8HAB6_9BACT|nr:alpha-amylase family glycosyl hydrolase [Jiulongibacter sediminis]KPM49716.1 alpha-amylase [Jiulongibacter sediminis]TBX26754.1 alpha-amylase [Jiulongibacter sediminis]